MSNSRTRNSILTMATSGIRQGLTLILTFVSRTVFIRVLGADYLGLNGLFSNVLSILALSELGIGSAISFYLYKPLVNQDKARIRALMTFYKRCYECVGLFIIVAGCSIMPFLKFIVNMDQDIDVNLYLVYFLYILNSASSYFLFAYKQALVSANQEQYKIEKINIAFTFINCLADIIILLIFRNYIVYLISKFLLVLIKNLITGIRIDKEYPYIKGKEREQLTKKEIVIFFNDIKSVALFRVGSTLFNATDNIIISIMLGTVFVGYYSNYYLIISQITVIVGLIIRSFSAGIGNVIAKENTSKQYEIFKQLDFGVYAIGVFCTTCLFQLLNSFVKIWIGGIDKNYVLSQSVVFFLVISFYFDTTSQITNSFREGSGNFAVGRSLQLVGGIVNIILSIILGKIFGLVGIFAATVIGKGCITVTPFLILVGRQVFGVSGFLILKKYYYHFLIMLLCLVISWIVCIPFHMKGMGMFVIECIVAAMIPLVVIALFFRKTPEMKALIERVYVRK